MCNKLYIYFYDLYSPVAFFLYVCVCVYVCACICGKRERATMNKQYVALPDPTERTNSGVFSGL